MWDLRLHVHGPPDSVAAIVAHYRQAVGERVALNGRADITYPSAWPNCGDADFQCVVGLPNQTAYSRAHLSDRDCPRRVAMKSVEFHRHIDIDDVAGFDSLSGVRDSVTSSEVLIPTVTASSTWSNMAAAQRPARRSLACS